MAASDSLHFQTDQAAVGFQRRTDFFARCVGKCLAAAEFTPDVAYYGDPRAPYGEAGITPEALFDRFSVARKSPLATFYVNVGTGADGNNGLTPGTAKNHWRGNCRGKYCRRGFADYHRSR